MYITRDSALIELEYLVHQIDNGYDFEQLNGFEIILGIIDGGLDNNLVKKSERVISAATQANAKGETFKILRADFSAYYILETIISCRIRV